MRDYSPRGSHVVRPRKRAKKKITDMYLLEAAISGGSALQYFRDRGECREVSIGALERGCARGIIDCDDLRVAMLTLKGEELLIELIGDGAVLSPGLELRDGLGTCRPGLMPWLEKARSNGEAKKLDESTEAAGATLVPSRL